MVYFFSQYHCRKIIFTFVHIKMRQQAFSFNSQEENNRHRLLEFGISLHRIRLLNNHAPQRKFPPYHCYPTTPHCLKLSLYHLVGRKKIQFHVQIYGLGSKEVYIVASISNSINSHINYCWSPRELKFHHAFRIC